MKKSRFLAKGCDKLTKKKSQREWYEYDRISGIVRRVFQEGDKWALQVDWEVETDAPDIISRDASAIEMEIARQIGPVPNLEGKRIIVDWNSEWDWRIVDVEARTLREGRRKIAITQYDEAYGEGYERGYYDGKQTGYKQGYKEGYDVGFKEGERKGFDDGHSAGYEEGYYHGYDDGYRDASR